VRSAAVGAALCVALPVAAQTRPAGEWPMAGKDYANTRLSELDEITIANASKLKIAFTFATGAERGHEAAPVVV